jgi:RNA polymerase sigma-70 factor (family 1)
MTNSENLVELQTKIALYNDAQAYKQLFFTFYNSLVKFAAGFVDSRESAEEVVSDVFIKVWDKRSTLETIGNIRVYLYVSTKNTALNYVAKQRKLDTVRLEDLNIDLPSTIQNPEQLMITAEMVRRIDNAINSLPPRCKLVFKLVKEDGLPYKEVADILNISVKTIDNQLAIALKKIAQAINLQLKSKMEY